MNGRNPAATYLQLICPKPRDRNLIRCVPHIDRLPVGEDEEGCVHPLIAGRRHEFEPLTRLDDERRDTVPSSSPTPKRSLAPLPAVLGVPGACNGHGFRDGCRKTGVWRQADAAEMPLRRVHGSRPIHRSDLLLTCNSDPCIRGRYCHSREEGGLVLTKWNRQIY